MHQSSITKKFCITFLVLLVSHLAMTTQAQAQQMQKKPSRPVSSARVVVQKAFYIVGGLLMVGGFSVSSPYFCAKPGSDVTIGTYGFYALIGGSTIFVAGPPLGEFDYSKMFPIYLTPEPPAKRCPCSAVGQVESVWSAMRRQCRIYQSSPESTASKIEIEGVASNFDILKSLSSDHARGLELCRYLEVVQERATEAKAQHASYSRSMAEDVVGRKLSENDAILFANMFALAGVRPGK